MSCCYHIWWRQAWRQDYRKQGHRWYCLKRVPPSRACISPAEDWEQSSLDTRKRQVVAWRDPQGPQLLSSGNHVVWRSALYSLCASSLFSLFKKTYQLKYLSFKTSGSTGKPKGVVHTTAGYLLGATLTVKYVFDLHPDDKFACMADVGWITGHT